MDDRSWECNANTIALDPETVIDVPPEWNNTKSYCASLGHKANHAFEASTLRKWRVSVNEGTKIAVANAKYDVYVASCEASDAEAGEGT